MPDPKSLTVYDVYLDIKEPLDMDAPADIERWRKAFRDFGLDESYLDGVKNGGRVLEDVQEIPHRERAGEYLMMRLRTTYGIHAEEYEKQYLLPFDPLEDILKVCRQRNFAILSDGRWRLSPEGMLLSNSILSDLLLAQERTLSASKRR